MSKTGLKKVLETATTMAVDHYMRQARNCQSYDGCSCLGCSSVPVLL